MFWNNALSRRAQLAAKCFVALASLIAPIPARGQSPDLEKLPYRQQPIDYYGPESDEPVSRLQGRLDRQELRLEFVEGQGYLRSLLTALDVPVDSQMLVFAKNSVNARLISPENPRALYFNDDVYVGWVPGAPALEVSAVDPRKGAIFYTLRQNADQPPRLVREESCLLCHASVNSLHVPGHLLRSFLTDPQGNPRGGRSRVDHDTPLDKRWGGWYVTGDFGSVAHQGNLTSAVDLREYERDPEAPGRRVDLAAKLGPMRYPSRQSDVVALLVHDHQVHMHNLITRVNYEERLRTVAAKPQASEKGAFPLTELEERLVRYMLFVDESPLASPVLGGSAFESRFQQQGPRDRQGRSLRQFDLETRLFRYRLSYLVYSRSFDALPTAAKDRIYRRIRAILQDAAPAAPFDKLPRSERQSIVEILRDTKPDLAESWSK